MRAVGLIPSGCPSGPDAPDSVPTLPHDSKITRISHRLANQTMLPGQCGTPRHLAILKGTRYSELIQPNPA
jgi:hypothetical protein